MQRIQEFSGLGQVDFVGLLGTWPLMQRATMSPGEPVDSVGLSILVRYYGKHPNELPEIRYPSFQEVFDQVARLWPEYLARHPEIPRPRAAVNLDPTALVKSKFCTWFGVQRSAAGDWESGREPTGVQERLWKLLSDLVTNEGIEGLEKFLEVVDEEARARGVPGGVGEIMTRRARVWPGKAWAKGARDKKGEDEGKGKGKAKRPSRTVKITERAADQEQVEKPAPKPEDKASKASEQWDEPFIRDEDIPFD